MEILFSLMVIVFWGYVGFVVSKYGILPSLSDSYYNLPEKYRDIIFTLVFFFTGLSACILGESGLMFFAGSGICFVGAAPQFKESFVKPAHVIGALSAALFSQLYIFFTLDMLVLNIMFLVSCMTIIFLKIKNRVWWLEMCCFVSSFAALGIKVFS